LENIFESKKRNHESSEAGAVVLANCVDECWMYGSSQGRKHHDPRRDAARGALDYDATSESDRDDWAAGNVHRSCHGNGAFNLPVAKERDASHRGDIVHLHNFGYLVFRQWIPVSRRGRQCGGQYDKRCRHAYGECSHYGALHHRAASKSGRDSGPVGYLYDYCGWDSSAHLSVGKERSGYRWRDIVNVYDAGHHLDG
jgi:hypothetical protein